MAKNTKTVRKRFDYRQCDDFAAYLNHMARQGWHFKEFRSKLVFEKGEPENSVYAVEIFTDGTEHDMQPSYKAMSFAEYCEAAGWKLVDQRVKWCVLKQIREDAVPIFTDEERFENVKSVSYAGRKQLNWLWLLLILLQGWLALTDPRAFLFKPSSLFILFYWVLRLAADTYLTLEHRHWCSNCEAKLERGEPLYFRQHKLLVDLLLTAPLLLTGLFFLRDDFLSMKSFWIVTGIFFVIYFLMTYLPKQRRVDADTSQIVSIASVVLLLIYLFTVFVMVAHHEENSPKPEPPLSVTVFRPEAEQADVNAYRDTTFFGSRYTCRISIQDDRISYYIYESRYDWVLDAVWKQELENGRELNREDWDALGALCTDEGRYAIRYEGRILILIPGPEPLKQDQIDTIISALKEG